MKLSKILTLVFIAILTQMTAPQTSEALILTDFAIFGEDRVKIGANSVIHNGLTGSNTEVILAGSSDVAGVAGKGTFTAKNGVANVGNLVWDGDAMIGAIGNFDGNIDIDGDVKIGNNTQVTGHVIASGNITNNGVILGPIQPFGTPAQYIPISLPAAKVFSAGGSDINTANNAVTNLAPGSYGDAIFKKFNTVNLTSGEYYFDSLIVNPNSKIIIDLSGGDVLINVVGDTKLGSHVQVVALNGDENDIFMEVHGEFRLKSGASFIGHIYTPFDDLHLENASKLHGYAWSGKEIIVDHGVQIWGGIPSSSIPEPASMTLFSLGLFGLGRMRKKILS